MGCYNNLGSLVVQFQNVTNDIVQHQIVLVMMEENTLHNWQIYQSREQ